MVANIFVCTPRLAEESRSRPTRTEAEAAVRTLIAYTGDDPTREGLLDTPKRVVNAYDELFQGYRQNGADVLNRTFTETAGYDDFVLVKDIAFNSHCEHHVMPFYGQVHVAYIPTDRVVGLSKFARLVDVFALRLQTQEQMTLQIVAAIEESLQPRGVAVMISAVHTCMSARGIKKADTSTSTLKFSGQFLQEAGLQTRFMTLLRAR